MARQIQNPRTFPFNDGRCVTIKNAVEAFNGRHGPGIAFEVTGMIHPRRRSLPLPVGIALSVLILPTWAPAGDEYSDFNELDLESLLDQTIVTASRQEQKLSDAPMAATVITAEQIAASGARSIPDLLRGIPGVDVIQTTSSNYDISARGLNRPGSNAMLVMIDGRSVYVDAYGLTVWDMLSVGIEDIASIEIIRGPGSVMHGANAFAGVINIITFAAGERPGTTARVYASDLGESYGALRHSDRRGPLSWRISSSWDRAENWELDRVDSDIVRFNGKVRWDLDDRTSVALGGGHVNGSTGAVVIDEPLLGDGTTSHVIADLVHGRLRARWSTTSFDVLVDPVYELLQRATVESHRHDVELQHGFDIGTQHHVLWGGRFRHSGTRFGREGNEVRDDIYAAFVLEEWSPRPELKISAGLRYEDHPRVGSHVAPRGGIVFKPADDHALHASLGRAYRNPTYVESYMYSAFEQVPGLPQVVRGDEGNQSETMTAYEVGYQGLVTGDILLQTALFHDRIGDVIKTEWLSVYPSPPAPFDGIPEEIAFLNGPSWRATGGELSLQTDPASWLRLSGQYSYVWLEDDDTGERLRRVPVHAGGLTATASPTDAHQIRLAARFRSVTEWNQDYNPKRTSDDRVVVDATWHVKLEDGDKRVTISARNLLDRRFRDHPLAIEQRRRLLMSVAVTF
ncbi:TonB-dependent receptor [bacterium]|nr:TonB-dependent receptor [bacterium]